MKTEILFVTVLIIGALDYETEELQEYVQMRGGDSRLCTIAELTAHGSLDAMLQAMNCQVVVNVFSSQQLSAGIASEDIGSQLIPLLSAIEQLGIPYVHLSSSAVFKREEGRRYREVDEDFSTLPLGQGYQHIESLVRQYCRRHIILRIGQVFAPRGDNLLAEMLRDFQRGGVELLLHGHGAPIPVIDFCRVISALCDQLSCGVDEWPVAVWGDYHYASSDPTTHYHFGETVLAVMAQYADTADIELIGVEEGEGEWRRPLLNCEKLQSTFGIKQLPWRAAIVGAVREYFETIQQIEKLEV